MKTPLLWLALSAGLAVLPNSEANAKSVTIPGNVISCYKALAWEILEWNVTSSDVRRYVNPENVLRDMRNPVTDDLKEKVITSTLNFVKFITRKVQAEWGKYSAQDVEYTQYKRWSHKILVWWNIGGEYSFKLYLEPSGCKVLNFTVEGLKSMRDGIPRL